MNYFHRLLMRSTSGSNGIRPIPHQPHGRLSNSDPLGSFEKNGDLTTELVAGQQLEHEANETHLHPQEWKRSSIDSMDKDAANPAIHPHESRTLMQHPLLHAMSGQKAQRAIDGSHIDSLHSHHLRQRDGHLQPLRDESQRPLQNGLIDDFHLMPSSSSQAKPVDSPSLFTPLIPLQNPMPAALRTSESDKFSRRQSETPAPEIHITIGRVEVRATVSPAPASKSAVKSSAMSLDEYLKQRKEGRR